MKSPNFSIKKEFKKYKNILITGGAGFIGGCLIRNLLVNTNLKIYNLDKLGYASDLESIHNVLKKKGENASKYHELLKVNLINYEDTLSAVKRSDPDLILHLAAESHVDRSIKAPDSFIESNILGTYNILKAAKIHYENLKGSRKNNFRFHHISTDEVFGSLTSIGFFDENSKYDPRSPYSASKAASDHLVRAWFNTYGLPVIITNCSNNYGPWQYPEKLIPITIINALMGREIPVYGDGQNIRDWLYVEDHVEALLLSAAKGEIGESYCIGGFEEKKNIEIVNFICDYMDYNLPKKNSHKNLINFVDDRLGHDKRYAINSSKIIRELGWEPKNQFKNNLTNTIKWYLNNMEWVKKSFKKG